MCTLSLLILLICRTFEESMQPEHLYLLFGILANLSKIFFIKLPASDEKEAKTDFRHFDIYPANSILFSKSCLTPAEKYPYLMRFWKELRSFLSDDSFLITRTFQPVSCMRMLTIDLDSVSWSSHTRPHVTVPWGLHQGEYFPAFISN